VSTPVPTKQAKEVSNNPIITALLAVSRALKKNGRFHWPQRPLEFANDHELQAQLAYDLALAVNDVWNESIASIRRESALEIRGLIQRIYTSPEVPTAVRVAYDKLEESKVRESQAQRAFDESYDRVLPMEKKLDGSFEKDANGNWKSNLPDAQAIETHPLMLRMKDAETVLFDARRERGRLDELLLEITPQPIARRIELETVSLNRRKASHCHETQRFFAVEAQSIIEKSVYRLDLYGRDLHWVADLSRKISSTVIDKRRFSISAFGFRMHYESVFAALENRARSKGNLRSTPLSKKEAFRIWIEVNGLLVGMSAGSEFHSLRKTCIEQQDEVDRFFGELGYKSFLAFRNTGAGNADQRIRQILKLDQKA